MSPLAFARVMGPFDESAIRTYLSQFFCAASIKHLSRTSVTDRNPNFSRRWDMGATDLRGKFRTARMPEFRAVCNDDVFSSVSEGRKARAFACSVPMIQPLKRILLSRIPRQWPSERIRPADHLILLHRSETWVSHFRLDWMVRPRNLIEVLGDTVCPLTRMGFGVKPKPISSLLVTFKVRPALRNHSAFLSAVSWMRYWHSSIVSAKMTSDPSSAKYDDSRKSTQSVC